LFFILKLKIVVLNGWSHLSLPIRTLKHLYQFDSNELRAKATRGVVDLCLRFAAL
jgi:hypothetical protein